MNNCLCVINQSFILEACLLNFQNVYFIYLDPLTAGCWQTYDLQYATAVKQLKPNAGRVLFAARRNTGRQTNNKQVQHTAELRRSLCKHLAFQKTSLSFLKDFDQQSDPRLLRSSSSTLCCCSWLHSSQQIIYKTRQIPVKMANFQPS